MDTIDLPMSRLRVYPSVLTEVHIESVVISVRDSTAASLVQV